MLDFVGLGAQKSGTTTLHHLLAEHPALTLPVGKEVPVFNEAASKAELARALDRVLPAAAGPGTKRGKIAPQYLTSQRAVDNLSIHCPQARLFVVLREPLERARSHHRMVTRRQEDTRGFTEAIADQLERFDTIEAIEGRPERDCYLGWGLYGAYLRRYSERFAAEQMLVTWTADLEAAPAGVLSSLHRHIGVDPVIPDDVDVRMNPSGNDGRRMRLLRRARRLPGYDVAKRLIPTTTRHSVAFRVEVGSRVEGAPSPELEPLPHDVAAAAEALFRDDHEVLAPLAGRPAPWYTSQSA